MNDDLISRQAVDDAIYDYSRSCDVNYAQIMEYIDKLPSVNPQPCEDSNANQHNSNALNALKGDAISRQKVLDVINLNWEYRRNCIRAIEKLPPVNPQEPSSSENDLLQRLRKRISDLYNTDVTYDNGDINTMDTPTLDKVLEYFDSEVQE